MRRFLDYVRQGFAAPLGSLGLAAAVAVAAISAEVKATAEDLAKAKRNGGA